MKRVVNDTIRQRILGSGYSTCWEFVSNITLIKYLTKEQRLFGKNVVNVTISNSREFGTAKAVQEEVVSSGKKKKKKKDSTRNREMRMKPEEGNVIEFR